MRALRPRDEREEDALGRVPRKEWELRSSASWRDQPCGHGFYVCQFVS